jgi:hypothetical protein
MAFHPGLTFGNKARASLKVLLLALLTIIRPVWKGLPGTDGLGYFVNEEKSFDETLAPG